MNQIQSLKLIGSMEAVLRRANGDVEVTRKDNIIVDVGFDFVADALAKPASRPGVLSEIGVGTGAAAAAPGDTALEAELDRDAATYTHVAGTKVFTLATTFAPGEATGAITEAGVINADNILFDRVVFAVINKGPEDTLTVTFTFTMS